MNLKHLASAIILIVVVFFAGRYTAPSPDPEIVREVETVTDTTQVDSLQSEVKYWQEIAESDRDTVINTIEVPMPSDEEGFNIYDVPYSDSTLSANIGLTVDGILEEVEFEYYLKRTFVTDKTTNIKELRVISRKQTKYIPRPTDRFNHHLVAGYMLHHDFEQTPYVEYQPSFRLFGFDVVGTVHLSRYPHFKIGTKIKLD
jgi:hypothetical protein